MAFGAIHKLGEDRSKEDQGLGIENSDHETFKNCLLDGGFTAAYICHGFGMLLDVA